MYNYKHKYINLLCLILVTVFGRKALIFINVLNRKKITKCP
jgi:hypothetical protein